MNAQAERLRRLAAARRTTGLPAAWLARCHVVASGKGGVGKSNLALNLALALAAQGHRPLLVDADVGLGSIEVLCGLRLALDLGAFLRGECEAVDVIEPGPGGVLLCGGGTALLDGAEFDRDAVVRLLAGLAALPSPPDHVVIDLPAGLGQGVRSWLAAATRVLLVVTPEPTSLTDAYAVCKFIARDNPGARVAVIVNRAAREREGRACFVRLFTACRTFLGLEVELLGIVPEDPAVRRGVAQQRPFFLGAPLSPAAVAVLRMAQRLGGAPREPAAAGLAGVLLRVAGRFVPRVRGGP